MAKKFVKVNGLHNVFEASANIASSTIKSGASASVDANSILFITADADDVDLFGSDYPSMKEGAHYIWAQGVLHDTNSGMVEVTVEGGDYLNTTGSQLGVGKAHIVVNHDESGVTAGTFGMAGASSVKAGGTIVVKIPNFTVDDYGHLTAANHSNLTIDIPAAETHKMSNHKALTLKVGGSSIVYGTTAATTVDIDAAINNKMATAVVYRGKATVDLVDGATTAASSLGITGYTTAKSGDLVISKDGIKEFMWNGSIWEEVGAEGKSVVAVTPVQKAGYEIGKIIVNGSTTTFYGRGVTAANEAKNGQSYKIGTITIEDESGADQTITFTGVDTKYGATNGVALTGGTFFQADLHSYTKYSVDAVAGTSANRYYQVGLDKSGKLAVNVPWQNNTYTVNNGKLTLQIAGAAKATHSANTASNATFNVPQASSSAHGVIKIGYPESGKNYPVELNSSGQAYVNVPWTDSNTTYGGSGGVELNSTNNTFRAALHSWDVFGATGVASTTANRYYRVGLDAAGKLAVNVPWTDTNTAHAHAAGDGIVLTGDTNGGTGTSTTTIGVTAATTDKYGGIKTNYTASGKNYPVKLDTNGNAYVSVPWQNNTYTVNDGKLTLQIVGATITTHSANTASNTTFNIPVASSSAYGVIKTGFAEANGVKKYAVKLDSNNKAYVEVPWTDTNSNTTYTLSGAVVGTTGSAAANSSVTTAVASAVSFVDTLKPSSGSATISTCILMNGDGSINLKKVSGKNNAIEIDYTGVATAEDWATIG